MQVKVRYSDFTTLTRQFSVEEPITEAVDIYRLGCFLLGRDKLVFAPIAVAGYGRQQSARTERTATRAPLN